MNYKKNKTILLIWVVGILLFVNNSIMASENETQTIKLNEVETTTYESDIKVKKEGFLKEK